MKTQTTRLDLGEPFAFACKPNRFLAGYQMPGKHNNVDTAEWEPALAMELWAALACRKQTLTIAEWRAWSEAWRLYYFPFPHLLKERKRSWLQLATGKSQRLLGNPKFQKTRSLSDADASKQRHRGVSNTLAHCTLIQGKLTFIFTDEISLCSPRYIWNLELTM